MYKKLPKKHDYIYFSILFLQLTEQVQKFSDASGNSETARLRSGTAQPPSGFSAVCIKDLAAADAVRPRQRPQRGTNAVTGSYSFIFTLNYHL